MKGKVLSIAALCVGIIGAVTSVVGIVLSAIAFAKSTSKGKPATKIKL